MLKLSVSFLLAIVWFSSYMTCSWKKGPLGQKILEFSPFERDLFSYKKHRKSENLFFCPEVFFNGTGQIRSLNLYTYYISSWLDLSFSSIRSNYLGLLRFLHLFFIDTVFDLFFRLILCNCVFYLILIRGNLMSIRVHTFVFWFNFIRALSSSTFLWNFWFLVVSLNSGSTVQLTSS